MLGFSGMERLGGGDYLLSPPEYSVRDKLLIANRVSDDEEGIVSNRFLIQSRTFRYIKTNLNGSSRDDGWLHLREEAHAEDT